MFANYQQGKMESKLCSFLLSVMLILVGCQKPKGDNSIEISEMNGEIEINNNWIKARFTESEAGLKEEYFSWRDGRWISLVESFRPPKPFPKEGIQLFNSDLDPDNRFLLSEGLKKAEIKSQSKDNVVVRLSGKSGDAPLEQLVYLNKDRHYFHFEISAMLEGKPAKLDYLLSTYVFNIPQEPTFVHTPGLKYDNEDSGQDRFELLPGRDHILGDRSFHAPAIILQEGPFFSALVPDLNAINEYAIVSPDARRTIDIPRNKFSVPIEDDKYTMPTGLDLNLKTGLTPKPVFTFGLMDNIIAHHIHYQRVNDTSMIRTLNKNQVRYAFDLFIGANEPENSGYQRISKHQWEKFGHPVFKNKPHLAMPFEEYLRIIDFITFNPIPDEEIDEPIEGYPDMGSWLQWEMDGLKVGGYRSSIPWWNDVLHNSVFWNNAREAPGFWFWGEKLNRPDLIDRAKRIINLCLSAPQNKHGLFALLYNAQDGTWGLQFSDPPHGKKEFFLRQSESYNIPAMSKTGAHMLDYYIRCEKDNRIINFLKPYGDWLLTVIDERGALPSYVSTNMMASPILHYSAHPAASMWFLAELHNTTGEEKYLEGARKISNYIEREILPEAKWIDMEQYFSCGKKPLDFVRDNWQNQIARGNLSIFWASEGFAALYRGTGNSKYLDIGEQCVDYATFTQCCWDPHFIYTAFPFGGFGVDNSDNAAMLDARQAEMVEPFIWYGKTLGRQDLLERGVAAARSSIVLINHPRHKSNNIYPHTNIYPFGLGPENIDHEAHPQSAMRTHPSWGEGSGVFTGLAEAYRELSGAYINFNNGLWVGVNGLRVDSASLQGKAIKLSLTNRLASLPDPWEVSFPTSIRVTGLSEGTYLLSINGSETIQVSDSDLVDLPIRVLPDGSIRAEMNKELSLSHLKISNN